MHQSVDALLVVDMVVPKHVHVGNIGLRVSLVGAIHAGKFDGISHKEDGQIVEDKVLVSFFCE